MSENPMKTGHGQTETTNDASCLAEGHFEAMPGMAFIGQHRGAEKPYTLDNLLSRNLEAVVKPETTKPIEQRLREAANGLSDDASYLRMLCHEAAAEIDRLGHELDSGYEIAAGEDI